MTLAARQLDPGLRVLVVEDHVDGADSMASLLRLYGYQVQIARDGLAACTCAATCLPDVVLLDIALPGCDGYEVARRIRVLSDGKPRPFLVAISRYAKDTDRIRSGAAGIDLHFAKPMDPEVLLGLLRRFAAARPERGEGH
jgi:CheY-like chemotaxis protein